MLYDIFSLTLTKDHIMICVFVTQLCINKLT